MQCGKINSLQYCIKVNINYPYVTLYPKSITPEQWNSLKRIMECLEKNPKNYGWYECPNDKEGLVEILTNNKGDTWLDLFELGLEEFMKQCKEGYTRGFFENLNEFMDEVGFNYANNDEPVMATDEAYRLKSLLAKGDKAYRIYYDGGTGIFYFQDAFGNKTHFDMLDLAKDNGWITKGSHVVDDEGNGLDPLWHEYMVFIPFNYDKQLRWHTRLGIDDYYDCRVYPFGVMFVRSDEAYNNPLFSALGDPEREIKYNSDDEIITIKKDGETIELDAYSDLNDVEDSYTVDIDTIKSNKEKKASKNTTPIKDGEVIVTPAFNIKNAKIIIHAVGPDFRVTPNVVSKGPL